MQALLGGLFGPGFLAGRWLLDVPGLCCLAVIADLIRNLGVLLLATVVVMGICDLLDVDPGSSPG